MRIARSTYYAAPPAPRIAPPTKELLRRQPVAARDNRDRLAALVAFGEDLRLLRRRPRPASTEAGKHLQPTNRFRLRFGQKLSVRHVSNPLDSASPTFADLRAALKVRSKGRLRSSRSASQSTADLQKSAVNLIGAPLGIPPFPNSSPRPRAVGATLG